METTFAQAWLELNGVGGFPLLTLLTALPLVFAAISLMLPGDQPGAHKALGFAGSIVTFLVSMVVWSRFDTGLGHMQLADDFAWIPGIGARWTMAVDGLSLPLVLLWRNCHGRGAFLWRAKHGCLQHVAHCILLGWTGPD